MQDFSPSITLGRQFLHIVLSSLPNCNQFKTINIHQDQVQHIGTFPTIDNCQNKNINHSTPLVKLKRKLGKNILM